jgi:hypothetical protein
MKNRIETYDYDLARRRSYRMRLWVGPVDVKVYADRLATDERFSKVFAGTEHVYFTSRDRADGWGAISLDVEAREVMFRCSPRAVTGGPFAEILGTEID